MGELAKARTHSIPKDILDELAARFDIPYTNFMLTKHNLHPLQAHHHHHHHHPQVHRHNRPLILLVFILITPTTLLVFILLRLILITSTNLIGLIHITSILPGLILITTTILITPILLRFILIIPILLRFIINIPAEEKTNLVRVCFQLELAHWFYIDFYVTGSPELKLVSGTIKEFAAHIFRFTTFSSSPPSSSS